ncbi:MAG: hypothetical protein FJ267_00860, partial [Planctomycetes bacterium]|nr:hypothetical protein [Planctomycetota bacterium]
MYCPETLESFRNALATVSDLNLYPNSELTPAAVDLKFAEGPLASGPESRVNVNVGFVPDSLSKLIDVETGLAEVVDWHRTAPLLQHVQLLDVQIADEPKLASGVSERDFEIAGYEIIAQSRTGPLILEKPSDGRTEFQFLFHPDRSSLIFRVGFPILVQNTIQIALQKAALSEVKAFPTGLLPELKVSPDTEVQVSGPSGFNQLGKSDSNGFLNGIE